MRRDGPERISRAVPWTTLSAARIIGGTSATMAMITSLPRSTCRPLRHEYGDDFAVSGFVAPFQAGRAASGCLCRDDCPTSQLLLLGLERGPDLVNVSPDRLDVLGHVGEPVVDGIELARDLLCDHARVRDVLDQIGALTPE